MKILIIHNDYQQPGGETAAVDAQAALLRDRGHSVVLYGRANRDLTALGVAEKAAFFPQTVYSRRTYREIGELAERERPDVAHVHNVFPLISPSAYRALHDLGVPIVQTVHNFRLMCPNGLFYTHGEICERCARGNTIHAVRLRCYRDSYTLSALYALTIGMHRGAGTFRLIDKLVVPAEFVAAKLVESGAVSRERVMVLHHFLMDPLPPPGSFTEREPYFLYLGRLAREKGIWTLLEAMRQLPHLRLKVLGSGDQLEPMRRYLLQNGMHNVDMEGFVSGDAKWDALRKAVAVVVPSEWYEVSPFSVVESLTAGTPVVASNLGNFPIAVRDHETGLLFGAGNSGALRDQLSWLAEHRDQALAMGRRARECAEVQYSAAAHYAKLVQVYEEVIPQRRPEPPRLQP